MNKPLPLSTIDDLNRLEGSVPSWQQIQDRLQDLREGWAGLSFKNGMLKLAGWDVDHPGSDAEKLAANNTLIQVWNDFFPKSPTAEEFEKALRTKLGI